MLPDYQARKLAILRPLLSAVVRLLGLTAGRPLSDRQLLDLAAVLTDTANGSRRQLADAAFKLYNELRPNGAEPLGPAPNLNDIPVKYFEKVVRSYQETLESEGNSRGAITRIAQATTSTVENAGREMIQAATRVDPVARGWARVLTGAENCGFCAMLASRGPVYGSRAAAGGSDDWHPGCDCLVVPVFRGHETEWSGYAEYQKLEDLWVEVTSGKRGTNALREFKKHFARTDVKPFSPLTSTP